MKPRRNTTDRHGNPLPPFVYRNRGGLIGQVTGAPRGGYVGWIPDNGDVAALAELGREAAAVHAATVARREAERRATTRAAIDAALFTIRSDWSRDDLERGRETLERLLAGARA